MTAWHLRVVVLPDGEPRDLYLVGDRLTTTRPRHTEITTIADGGYALPGLVDVHCHVGLTAEGAADLATSREQALTDRDHGALLLRDAGAPVRYPELDDDPALPRIVHAGRHIARTRRYLKGFGIEIEPEDLVATVETQARRSGGHGPPWVKIVADWIDRDVGDLAPCWPAEVLAAAVRRAHELGARVAVHVFGEEALPDLIAAGVDSIEHGTGLTDDTIAAAAAADIAVVPTVLNVQTFDAIADRATRYPVYAARMRRLKRSAEGRLRAAYEAGIRLFVGTDAGGGLPHGLVVDEMIAMAAIGLPNETVLAAGSWAARSWLGLPGIVEGAFADLVVYDDDPRRDLAVLRHPRRIVVRGTVVR
ncbi:MAG: amidohydrolase family protein [Acidothermus sp.]|nr:amidohydrolase family protein [Acidothermus sp.]